ncbi:MAG: hypothetical protein JRH20_20675, partial [Deltaproteobacteria bacterium]|nr:hypothetical protein [Deltaproteobacteria bacterium]
AIDNYRPYLKRTKKKDATLRARIGNLEARLKASTPKPVHRPVHKPADKPTDKPADKPDEPGVAKPGVTPPVVSEPEDPKSSGGGGWMKIAGWSLVGVGGASIVTSFIFGAAAAGKASTVEEAYATAGYDWSAIQGFEADGKSFEGGQIVTLIVGIIAAGAGTTLLFLAPSGSAETEEAAPTTSAQVTPLIGGNILGLSTRFSF